MSFVSLGFSHESTLWASQQPCTMLTCASSLLNVNNILDVFAGVWHVCLSANQMVTLLLESAA